MNALQESLRIGRKRIREQLSLQRLHMYMLNEPSSPVA